ncbi:hypothetical protein KSP40_PGU019403 [Platanthera guangdongensis]|uniref:Glycine-rich protein n=1 Tax=Platanthera guangdongensis TaxID=2320717 RepID=A0ABR2LBQ8_9ASPA
MRFWKVCIYMILHERMFSSEQPHCFQSAQPADIAAPMREAFSWESVKDAVKGLGNKNKVQDILWDQIRRREFGGDAADGNPPGRPGGGGGADGTDGEGYGILEETLQVFLATIAFILVYIYIIRGADLTMLARDYFKYCVCGVQSMRLQRIINKWRRVCGPRSLRIGWNGQLMLQGLGGVGCNKRVSAEPAKRS